MQYEYYGISTLHDIVTSNSFKAKFGFWECVIVCLLTMHMKSILESKGSGFKIVISMLAELRLWMGFHIFTVNYFNNLNLFQINQSKLLPDSLKWH